MRVTLPRACQVQGARVGEHDTAILSFSRGIAARRVECRGTYSQPTRMEKDERRAQRRGAASAVRACPSWCVTTLTRDT